MQRKAEMLFAPMFLCSYKVLRQRCLIVYYMGSVQLACICPAGLLVNVVDKILKALSKERRSLKTSLTLIFLHYLSAQSWVCKQQPSDLHLLLLMPAVEFEGFFKSIHLLYQRSWGEFSETTVEVASWERKHTMNAALTCNSSDGKGGCVAINTRFPVIKLTSPCLKRILSCLSQAKLTKSWTWRRGLHQSLALKCSAGPRNSPLRSDVSNSHAAGLDWSHLLASGLH